VGLDRLSADELPRVFAVLGQASRLLERSIAKNLVIGLDIAPDEERMRATLRRVKLDELAERAPEGAASTKGAGPSSQRGLDTEFRAIPPSFSGGEQRRLLLARMLVRDARIFVLDEPESGLPSATAEEILRAVAELAGGRTCLVVTHAPHLLASTFNVVMAEGKIAAMGSHDHLVATSEIYRALLAEGLRGPGKAAPGVAAMPGPPGRPAGMA
jgi:ABC-type transport system involved in cytochrome bd biosynthesis fused ATPase/permease subunit